MTDLNTINHIFISFPLRKWEIMETYLVTFHNFRFPGGERGKNTKKWLPYDHVKNSDYKNFKPKHFGARYDVCPAKGYLFSTMTLVVIHRLTTIRVPVMLRQRCQKYDFCHTVGIFSHLARPAVPHAPKGASRHSGAGFLRGGRTNDHATI
jgi:hypothetical protein